ncbi:MAG: hypothetical protein ACJASJ_000693, partial [Candidatus Azotimanducaceae bacterium]
AGFEPEAIEGEAALLESFGSMFLRSKVLGFMDQSRGALRTCS